MGIGYKGWKCKHRLHTKGGWECMTNWIGDIIMMNKKFIKKHWKNIALGVFILLAVIFGEAKASYTFPYPTNDRITMDVDHTNGGGTYSCPSVQACYIKVLEAEARGATQYCNNITIKRNGKIIWWRKYR